MINKYRILLLSAVFQFLTLSISIAQSWPKQYLSSGWGCNVWDLKEDYDKGILIAGQVVVGDIYGYQSLLIKTDINGNKLWSKEIGNGEYSCSFSDIKKTIDNGIIISGSISKYDKPNIDDHDAFLLKLNTCGEKEWCTVFRTSGDNYGTNVIQQADGSYVTLIMCYGGYYDSIRITIAKVDSDGNPLWVRHQAQYNQASFYNEAGDDLLLTSDGNFLITGGCQDPSAKPFWILTDTEGNEMWNKRWGGLFGYVWESVEDQYGNFYAGGEATSPSWAGGYTPSLFKVDKHGNAVYHKYLMGDTLKGGGAGPLCFLNDTTIVIGTVWAPKGSGLWDGYNDVLLIDTLGTIQKRRFLMEDIHGPEKIIKTSDNKILVTGSYVPANQWSIYLYKLNFNLEDDSIYTQPCTYDSLCPYPIVSDTIDIDCYLYTSLDKLPTQNQYESAIEIWPNPGSSSITIKPHKLCKLGDELKILDLQAKEMKTIEVNTINPEYLLNIQDLPDGFYLVQHSRQKRVLSTGKLIVKH